ncbi:hypothetical protein DL96DRAFT_1708989 [Flagelloscypha sp. PMI_526]|nr:hypothetical protein DL96DRAFT_1708989 [Flagelloscypha sp. PMI_526]
MASEDADFASEIIPGLGYDTLRGMISLFVEGILWGFYLVLFLIAIFIQWRRGFRTIFSRVMISVTLVLFASSTTLLTVNFTTYYTLTANAFVKNLTLSWTDRLVIRATESLPLNTPMEALFLFNMLVGDAVVIVRTKIIWGTNHWRIVAIPLICLVASLIFSITGTVCISLEMDASNRTSSQIVGSWVCRRSEPIAWALSLLINLFCTLLVAWRTWAHRKFQRELLGPSRRLPTSTERVLALLVESGFLYFLFLSSQVVLFIEDDVLAPTIWAYAVLAPFGDQISGIYSTSVIVLVVLQKTWNNGEIEDVAVDPAIIAKRGEHKTLTPLRFGQFETLRSERTGESVV